MVELGLRAKQSGMCLAVLVPVPGCEIQQGTWLEVHTLAVATEGKVGGGMM